LPCPVISLLPSTYPTSTSEGKKEMSAKWTIKNNLLSFEIKNYEGKEKLLIDPDDIVTEFRIEEQRISYYEIFTRLYCKSFYFFKCI
jgi:hypothetical protein